MTDTHRTEHKSEYKPGHPHSSTKLSESQLKQLSERSEAYKIKINKSLSETKDCANFLENDQTISLAKNEKAIVDKIRDYLSSIEKKLNEKKYEEILVEIREIGKFILDDKKSVYIIDIRRLLSETAFLLSYISNYIELQFMITAKSGYPLCHTPLPVDSEKLSPQINEVTTESYQSACEYKHSNFPEGVRGQISKPYELSERSMLLNSDEIIESLLKQFKNPLVIDLGTGEGKILDHYSKSKYQNLTILGIEAENDLKLENKNIIRGNIGDLPKTLKNLDRKPHAFISRYVFDLLCNPLKVICDAYAMLEKGGFLFIADVKIEGLTLQEINKLSNFLTVQGYEIIVDKYTRKDDDFFWMGSIFIKKNHKQKLEFPLQYSATFLSMRIMTDQPSYVDKCVSYAPNATLLDFTPTSERKQDFYFIVQAQTLNQWLSTSTNTPTSTSSGTKKEKPIVNNIIPPISHQKNSKNAPLVPSIIKYGLFASAVTTTILYCCSTLLRQ